jgi:hypothetical protein
MVFIKGRLYDNEGWGSCGVSQVKMYGVIGWWFNRLETSLEFDRM